MHRLDTAPPTMTVPAPSAPRRRSVLMLAYSHYESDPRIIRAAEAARDGGFVDESDALDDVAAFFRM